jgi:hypothetical protein
MEIFVEYIKPVLYLIGGIILLLVGSAFLVVAEGESRLKLIFTLIGLFSSVEGVVVFVYSAHLFLQLREGE